MRVKRDILIILLVINTLVVISSVRHLDVNLHYHNYISRRVKTSSFSIQSLLESELPQQERVNKIIEHLWQSWDEIIPNLRYVTDNFNKLYRQNPELIDAFLASVMTDIRTFITPSLFSDIDSVYQNLDKLSELWNIEDNLVQILLFLDKTSGGEAHITRFLVNSLFRIIPGRIDVEMFKKLYKESNTRGRVEITYTDSRDWSAARHGVTVMSKVVSAGEVDAEIKSLENNGFVIDEVIVKEPGTPESMSPEFQHLSTREIDFLLTIMTNIIQRPFRMDTSVMNNCYEWWKSLVGEEIASNFEKTIEFQYPSWIAYFSNDYREKVVQLSFMRETLAKIIYSEDTPNNVKTATIIFDKYLSSMLKETAMNLVDWYQKSAEKDDRKGYAFSRFASPPKKQSPEKKYREIISTINLLLRSLILGRNVPHRLWLDSIEGKRSYIEINPYDKNGKLDYKKLYTEISYLENVLNEIVKAMHGEIFELGRDIEHPYQEWISQKFDIFSQQYNQIVEMYLTKFPDLSSLKLHAIDTPIALSLLRQIEICKDTLKSIFAREHPEFFYDSQGLLDLLYKMRTRTTSYYYINELLEHKFSQVTPEVAQEADGLIITSIVPHPQDSSKVILVAVRDLGDRARIYHIITDRDNLPLKRTGFSMIKARYSDGVNFPTGIYQTVVYSPYLKPEEAHDRIVLASTPDPNIINLFQAGIVGIICETGGVTTHLMNIARDLNIPGLAATEVRLSQLLPSGMPVYVIGNEIYFLLYSYREGDTAYIAW